MAEELQIEELQCVICIEDFAEGQFLRHLPCGHYFHQPCLDLWLKNHTNCPICRRDLLPPAPSSELQEPGPRTGASNESNVVERPSSNQTYQTWREVVRAENASPPPPVSPSALEPGSRRSGAVEERDVVDLPSRQVWTARAWRESFRDMIRDRDRGQ